ncbi:MAG: DUF1643 domain-containing protein [Campylobacterota bacterium]|nr:DUF1643 domain-containing protein [Campylobacterota bacterium]
MEIPHYEKVDINNIVANFTDDLLHRSSLTIPFFERKTNKSICIIGQNPSHANEEYADKTLQYFEKLIFDKFPQYSKIIMLNLYSRIDTQKKFNQDLEREETYKELLTHLKENSDFLLAFGASKKDGAYNFYSKIQELKPFLSSKNLYKIDIGNTNYPPHPGNPKIFYNNFSLKLTQCKLLDV